MMIKVARDINVGHVYAYISIY